MNQIAHLSMATETNSTLRDGYGFGAILPSFESLADTLVDVGQLPEQVSSGVVLHEKAEKVYCDSPGLRSLNEALLQRVVAKKLVPRQFAGDYARLGTEFLLNGYLLQRTAVVDQYRTTMDWVESNRSTIVGAANERLPLDDLLDSFVFRGIPAYFKSPYGTAAALGHSMAGMHQDFQIPPREDAADILGGHQLLLRQAAGKLFADVLAGIRAA